MNTHERIAAAIEDAAAIIEAHRYGESEPLYMGLWAWCDTQSEQRALSREWRQRNPEKVRAIAHRYYLKQRARKEETK